MFADAISSALGSLEHSNGGSVPATLLVTSALPREGKSLIARALALELVATGRKVLLVDWNLRRGKVRSQFGSGAEPGLSDFVWGESDLADFIYHDIESGVDYIPRGNRRFVQFPQRELASQIIRSARVNGQVLIFDGAPALTSPETSVLAALTERTLLTVRWGGTRRRAVEFATHRLQSIISANLMIVMNMVKPRRHALYGFRDAELFTTTVRRYYRRLV
jgi:Mrp family chromosome partitioning ATPase